jgi:hypothetical protein
MRIGSSQYDPELQMFTDGPHEPDGRRLRFLRWLVEQGRLEHSPAGDSAGEYAQILLSELTAA